MWQNIWRLYQNRQNSRKLIPAKLLAPTVSFIRRLPLWRQRLNSTIKRNRSYRQFFKLQGVKKETSVMKWVKRNLVFCTVVMHLNIHSRACSWISRLKFSRQRVLIQVKCIFKTWVYVYENSNSVKKAFQENSLSSSWDLGLAWYLISSGLSSNRSFSDVTNGNKI